MKNLKKILQGRNKNQYSSVIDISVINKYFQKEIENMKKEEEEKRYLEILKENTIDQDVLDEWTRNLNVIK